MKEYCKYRLPCGRCEKLGAPCDAPEAPEECKHDWLISEIITDSFGVVNYYVCSKCGKTKSLLSGI